MLVWRKIGSILILFCLSACVPVNQKKVGVSDTSQTVDTTPPTNTSISIDSGAASTNSTSVFLTLEATEATEMYVTNTPGCGSGGAWESFITARTWTLGQTNGVATVYVKFRDALLNESSCINDDIFQVDEDPVVGSGPTFSSVTNNSATVSWGAASDSLTPTPNLDYKLVRATSPDLIDTVLEADAIAGSGLVMDWDTNVLTASATGLTDATTYFFAVLVRDEVDNKALYSPDSVKTLDGVAPTVGTNLVFSSVTSTSMTVSWGAASDNVTPQESLRYKLVKSISSDAIDTIAEVEAITGDDLLVDWDVNTTTHNVTGLTVDTTYYFAVLVQDAYDNLAIYPIASETTFDGVAPTIGTSISFSSVTGDSMTVSWGAGSDNVTAQESLQYKLVKATTGTDIDSIEEVEAISGGDLLVNWGTNILSHGASGLLESTTYYFSVVVRDSSGNKALYTVQGQSTSDSTAPVIGSGISFSAVTNTSMTVLWGGGTDNVTAQASLQYKLVKANTSSAIDTISEVESISGADLLVDWGTNTLSFNLTGLSGATTYYFSVIVRDSSNNKALYPVLEATTQSHLSFISRWNTTRVNGSTSDSYQISLPLEDDGTYDFTVDWGDGMQNTISSGTDPNRTHTYAEEGSYTVTITGTIIGFNFYSPDCDCSQDAIKLNDIVQFGPLRLGNNGSYFANAQYMSISATDALDLTGTFNLSYAFKGCYFSSAPSMALWDTSQVTDMFGMFREARNFNQDIGAWDTSNVTNMAQMFYGAEKFNKNIETWDTRNVTDMAYMFMYAKVFNQPISNWDTGNVTNMNGMFYETWFFNQEIGNWDTSNVTTMTAMFQSALAFNGDIGNWNTGSVTSMFAMFNRASAFNRDIGNWNVSSVSDTRQMFFSANSFNQDIGSWNTENVTLMDYMFSGATAFDQDLGSWNITKVTSMANMFFSAELSTVNYDSTLQGWAAQIVKTGVPFHGGFSNYSPAASSARSYLIGDKGWAITDGGPE